MPDDPLEAGSELPSGVEQPGAVFAGDLERELAGIERRSRTGCRPDKKSKASSRATTAELLDGDVFDDARLKPPELRVRHARSGSCHAETGSARKPCFADLPADLVPNVAREGIGVLEHGRRSSHLIIVAGTASLALIDPWNRTCSMDRRRVTSTYSQAAYGTRGVPGGGGIAVGNVRAARSSTHGTRVVPSGLDGC